MPPAAARRYLAISTFALTIAACDTSSNPAVRADPPRAARAAILDPTPTDGAAVRIAGRVDLAALRGCDAPPENQAATGAALLQARRDTPGSGYDQARRQWILAAARDPADSAAVVGDLRERYDRDILPTIPVAPIGRVEPMAMTVTYERSFTQAAQDVRVRGRRLRFTIGDPARPRRVDAYFLNYDRVADDRRVVLVLAGRIGREGTEVGLDPRGGYAAALVGRIAAAGWPLVALDATADRFEDELAAIRMLDRSTLASFRAVDLVGVADYVLHLVAFHTAPIASAYVIGSFVPLWTRNDIGSRTGGPFAVDRPMDDPLVQSRFQWADFVLMAADEDIRLGLLSNAGGSGLGKAGLFGEILPQIRRFPQLISRVEVRGNDRDGDGVGDRGERCHEGEFEDALDFLRAVRSPMTPASGATDVRARGVPATRPRPSTPRG